MADQASLRLVSEAADFLRIAEVRLDAYLAEHGGRDFESVAEVRAAAGRLAGELSVWLRTYRDTRA
jgi:hypothetical protein